MPRMTALVSIVAVLALMIAAGIAQAAVPADAGTVLALYGQCFDEASGQRTPLRTGDIVHVGDTVDVPAGGAKLRIRLNDGSVISIASGTRMTIQTSASDGEGQGQHRQVALSMASGLVRAVVASVSQPSSFEITTATAVAAARATDWFVEARPSATRVGVLSGAVGVTGHGATVLVPVKSGTDVDAGRAPQAPRVWTQAEFDELVQRTNLSAGWCQCIDDHTRIQGACFSGVDACQAFCAGGHYSFVPEAPGMCGGGS